MAAFDLANPWLGTSIIAGVWLATSCARQPGAVPHERSIGSGFILVSHSVPAQISKQDQDVESETIELHIEADRTTMIRRSERFANGRWTASKVDEMVGIARRTADGWLLVFPWQELMTIEVGGESMDVPANWLRLSCSPVSKRVHVADARPVGLCTPSSRWTGSEVEVAGWWCADLDRRMFLRGGRFFTPPAGVEDVSVACCPEGSDACDGWDSA
ncbi:MAG: hypothetical protein AB7O24_26505 [Kofleriaceae bacterium]